MGIYLNVGLTVRYKRPSGVTAKPALFHALSMLISKHPILSAIPFAVDTPNPYFIRLPKIVLSEVVTFVKDDSSSDWIEILDEVIEEQHNRPFDIQLNKNLPFWRFCVLESNQDPTHFILVFVFHHALMDTKSALSFHEELEECIAEYAGLEPSDTIYSPSHALFPPLEELHTLPVSQEFLQSQEKHHEPSPDSWTGSPQVTPVKTRFSSLWLSETETRRLAAASKKKHTSITAALQTLITAGLFSVLPSKYRKMQADCAVSLRRFLPEPVTATTLGCYVGSLSMTYHRMPSFDWAEARRTKVNIEQAVAKKGGDMPVGYLKFIPNQHIWMRQKLGRKRMSGFELSNVGASSVSRGKRDFEIESILFSQSSSACSAAIKVSAVTGPDGRLALGFTWQEGIVEADMVEKLKGALKSEVERLAISE